MSMTLWCTNYFDSIIIDTSSLLASLASATAGVALLAPFASRRVATQCLSIIEVIKLSGYVHSVENQDSHAKKGVSSQCVQPLC